MLHATSRLCGYVERQCVLCPTNREVERYFLSVPALVEAVGEKKTEKLLLTRDISNKGSYLHTNSPMEINTRVKISVIMKIGKDRATELGNHVFYKFSGYIHRVEKDGMAVKFDEDYQLFPATML